MTEQIPPAAPWFIAVVRTAETGETTSCATPAALRTALSRRGALGVLTYEPPAQALAARMAEAGDQAADQTSGLAAWLDAWRHEADAWLALHRKQRARLTLVERPRDAAAMAALAQQLGEAPVPQHRQAAPDASVVALATLALGQDAAALALADALQASTLGPVTDPSEAFEALETLRADLAARSAALAALSAQSDAQAKDWAQRLARRESELSAHAEATEARLAQTLRESAVLGDQLIALETELRTAEAARAKREAERDALQAQLATQTRDAETLRSRQAKAAADQLRAAQAKSAETLGKIRAEAAVLLEKTGALEAELNAAETQRRHRDAELARLRTQAAEQLRKAEARTTTALKTATLETAAMAEQVTAMESCLLASESRRAALVDERAFLDRVYRKRITALTATIDELYKSTSWRLTSPARAVVRRIFRH